MDMELFFCLLTNQEKPRHPNDPSKVYLRLASRYRQLISPTRSSGVLKPREMCLVLGCPGSGCSTFLKTIANQREGYARVSGEVLYAGIDSDEMHKYYKGEVVYNLEGVSHSDKYQSPL